jgi:hypothetical protein
VENAREGNSYFQGANTIRLEKKFNDWFFGSAGYLYSQLNSDASFTDSVNNSALRCWTAFRISLWKRNRMCSMSTDCSARGNGLTFSTGVEAEWTSQHGFGGNNAFLNPVYTNGLPFAPATVAAVPTILSSDYDQNTVTENAALRYSKIPYTALFLEARLQQQSINQFDSDLQPATAIPGEHRLLQPIERYSRRLQHLPVAQRNFA